jgi:hypothetical protein
MSKYFIFINIYQFREFKRPMETTQKITLSDSNSNLGVILHFNIEDFTSYGDYKRDLYIKETTETISKVVSKIKNLCGLKQNDESNTFNKNEFENNKDGEFD